MGELGDDQVLPIDNPFYSIGGGSIEDSIEGTIHIGLESNNLLGVLESVSETILIIAGGGSMDITPFAGALLGTMSVFSMHYLSGTPTPEIHTFLAYNNPKVFPCTKGGGGIIPEMLTDLPVNIAIFIFGQEDYNGRSESAPSATGLHAYLPVDFPDAGSLAGDTLVSVVRMIGPKNATQRISGLLEVLAPDGVSVKKKL